MWKQLDVMLQCVDEVVGAEIEDEEQAMKEVVEEDTSEAEEEL